MFKVIRRISALLSRYMDTSGSVSFWHTAVFYQNYDFSSLQGYYINFASKTSYKGHMEGGIPLLDYKGDIGIRYNPCAVAQYALGWYEVYLELQNNNRIQSVQKSITEINAAQEKFINCARWLQNALVSRHHGEDVQGGVWLYDFDLDAYDIQAPWISGLAQGQGISVLLRAYVVTQDTSFLESAKQAYTSMLAPISQEGTLHTQGQHVYIEEVTTEKLSCILDGFIFSIFSVFDYYFVTHDPAVKNLCDQLIFTLKDILPQYDLGFWSRADVYNTSPKMPASAFYHNLHIEQLKAIHALTGDKYFLDISEKWDAYQGSFFCKKYALLKKVIFKIFYY